MTVYLLTGSPIRPTADLRLVVGPGKILCPESDIRQLGRCRSSPPQPLLWCFTPMIGVSALLASQSNISEKRVSVRAGG
jgi:hypothetical protein